MCFGSPPSPVSSCSCQGSGNPGSVKHFVKAPSQCHCTPPCMVLRAPQAAPDCLGASVFSAGPSQHMPLFRSLLPSPAKAKSQLIAPASSLPLQPLFAESSKWILSWRVSHHCSNIWLFYESSHSGFFPWTKPRSRGCVLKVVKRIYNLEKEAFLAK